MTACDYSHALLGIQAGAAVQRLPKTVADPLASGILRRYDTSSREFRRWVKRISAVSSQLIRGFYGTAIRAAASPPKSVLRPLDFIRRNARIVR